ncbi:MAG: hypothetical protein QOH48_968 [Actinomycetota bacterium]|jgi:hypothetical protein|nr:hypothetical protein [Actinomycetota bacterium]
MGEMHDTRVTLRRVLHESNYAAVKLPAALER